MLDLIILFDTISHCMTAPSYMFSMVSALTLMSLSGLNYVQASPELLGGEVAVPVASALKQDAKLRVGKLDNGMSYLIRPCAEPKGRASMRLYVAAGSLDECEATSGVSHFLEHLLFNGSRTHKRGELIPEMQKKGFSFGRDVNAYTGLLQTVYMMDLPNLKPETVDFTLTVMRDFADGATLSDEAIDKERGVIVSELKARDSATYRAQIEGLRQISSGTRIADFLPIGREEFIKNAPYEAFRKYYRDNYSPERLTFILTGDVNADEAEAWIKKTFSSMEAKSAGPRPAIRVGEIAPPTELVISNPESALATISISIVNPWTRKEDTEEKRIADLPLSMAQSMLNSRLARMAREENSPFMAAAVSEQDLYRAANVFTMGAQAKPAEWKKAITALENETRRAAEFGFSAVELNESLANTRSALKTQVDTWESVDAAALANGYLTSIEDYSVITDPQEDVRVFEKAAALLLKNPDLCRKALAAVLDEKRANLSLMGTIEEGVTKEVLRQSFNEACAMKLSAPAEEKLKPFAYDNIGEAGKVVEQAVIEDIGVTTLTLSNGVRVNLKPIDFKKGSINLIVNVDGGSLLLDPKPGLSQLVAAVMLYGGLEEHSMDDLQKILAGKRVSSSFDISNKRLVFSGQSNEADLELQCKLMAAAIMHPGYRENGKTLLMRSLPAYFNRLKTTPKGAYQLQAPPLLFGNDKRFVLPAQAEIEACSIEDVKNILTPALKDGAMEVSIVGDFDVAKIIPVLERSFGAMPQRKAEFSEIPADARKVNFQPWGQRSFLPYETELDKTIVTHIRPAGNGRDDYRNRRLVVLSAILREKLFDGIRAALGETYSPSVRLVTNNDFDNAAYFLTESAGVKGNRVMVSSAMDSILAGLGQKGISKEDFERAILPIRAQAKKAQRNEGYWLASIESLQSDESNLGLLRGYLADIDAITYEEVNILAKTIFGANAPNPISGTDKASFFFTVPEDAVPATVGDDAPKAIKKKLVPTQLLP